MDNRDVTREIRPTDALGILMWEALHARAYRKWVPQWSWDLYKKDGQRLGWMIRQAGITDEMIDLSQLWDRKEEAE